MLENEPVEDFVQISLTYGKMHPLLKKALAYIALYSLGLILTIRLKQELNRIKFIAPK